MTTLAAAIIAATLLAIAVGAVPGLHMNRSTIAVVGATALVIIGALTLPQAYAAIDLDTMALLFGMMVLNANLRLAGFFELVAVRLARGTGSAPWLLGATVFVAGVLSALFLNDTIVLVFTPLVLEVTRAAGLPAVPFLMAVATAANVGSVATIIGNPQNMLVGAASGIPFVRFTAALGPVALGGLAIVWLVLLRLYPSVRGRAPLRYAPHQPTRIYRPLLRKSSVALAVLLTALLAGAPPPLAAMGAASLLLVTRRLKPERVFREIDWSLLVFFAGLFVITHAVEVVGLGDATFGWVRRATDGGVVGLTVAATALSNVISNVPAVLLLRPVVTGLADPERAWLTLAMASTLAGNLTLLGSVANLIVAETAGRHGERLSFGEYLKAGVPITVVTLGLGVVWLAVVW